MAAAIRASERVVALTGAGVSTASGIPDYRSSGGLWREHDWTTVATLSAFRRDPDLVWRFYRERLAGMASVEPNPAHLALAELEARGYLHGLITQNVDGLHHRAGSRDPVEVHGNLDRAICLRCDARVERAELDRRLACGEGAPACDCGAPLKPGIVMFEEGLDMPTLERAEGLARSADLLLCCGSSLEVHPVAGLAPLAVDEGAALVILTAGPTPYDELATLRSAEPLAELLPATCALLREPGEPVGRRSV